MPSNPRLNAAMDLSRRLPPERAQEFLNDLIDLAPDLTDQLLASVDRPLIVGYDERAGKEYLMCEYNRDGDSYRSCWSNTYDPPLENGLYPSERMRRLEIHANAAFESYKNLYFDGGISSVYFWDSDSMIGGGSSTGSSFNGVVLMKKVLNSLSLGAPIEACWDSMHVVTVQERSGSIKSSCHYKVISSALLWLESGKTETDSKDGMELGGTLVRTLESDAPLPAGFCSHIANIGRLVEDMENRMRNSLDAIYFGKTRDVINRLRALESTQINSGGLRLSNEFKEHLENYFYRKSRGE